MMPRIRSRFTTCGLLILSMVGAMGFDAASSSASDFKLTLAQVADPTGNHWVRCQALVQPKPLTTGSDTVSLDWVSYDNDANILDVYDADTNTIDPHTPATAVGGSGPAFFTDTKYVKSNNAHFEVLGQGLDVDHSKSIGPLFARKAKQPKLRIRLKDFKKTKGGRTASLELNLTNATDAMKAGVAYTAFYDKDGKRLTLDGMPRIAQVFVPVENEKAYSLKPIQVSLPAEADKYPVYVVFHSWIHGDDDEEDARHSIRIPLFEP